MLTAQQKSDALFEFADTLRYDQRIVFSNEGNLWSVNNVYHSDQYKDRNKPNGLWYSFGKSWITYLKKETKSCHVYDDGTTTLSMWGEVKLREITHIYQLHLDEDKLIKIHSKEDLILFEKAFKILKSKKECWKFFSKNNFGIEIKHPHYMMSNIFYGWDCGSGCIWNRKAVKSIKLLKSWTPFFE